MSATGISGDHLQERAPDPGRGAEVEHQSPGERAEPDSPQANRRRWVGLAAGLLRRS